MKLLLLRPFSKPISFSTIAAFSPSATKFHTHTTHCDDVSSQVGWQTIYWEVSIVPQFAWQQLRKNGENPASGQRRPSRDRTRTSRIQVCSATRSVQARHLSSYRVTYLAALPLSSPVLGTESFITYAKSYSLKSLHSMPICCSPILFVTCFSTFSKLSIHVYSGM
jgi:hypothetical protein